MPTPAPSLTSPDAPLPDLLDPQVRAQLSGALPAVLRMLDAWNLTRTQQTRLLTLSPRTILRVSQGKSLPRLNQDQLTRMSLITGIYAALHTVYGGPVEDGWVKQPNRRPPFNGRAPLNLLLVGGIPRLLSVRRLLDADRSGQFGSSAEARLEARSLQQPDIHLPDDL